jgi:hypothetical protein
MKYDQEKIPAGEKEYYSYIHPKYPFIRSNRNLQMVKALLQSHIFPDRMTLEKEMCILEKHKIHSDYGSNLRVREDSSKCTHEKTQLQKVMMR